MNAINTGDLKIEALKKATGALEIKWHINILFLATPLRSYTG